MVSMTQHYNFTKLDPGESVHAGTGAFPAGDRDLIDALLNALASHQHTGGALEDDTPTDAPGTALSTTGGTIPAGVQVAYVWTIVDPDTGETAPSPVAELTTAAAVADPAAPTFTLQSIGGTLLPGTYFYVATAYTGANTVETKASNPVEVVIPAGTSTNQVELTLPAKPGGVTGYNVYRRAPNEARYYHIGTTTTTAFIDAGASTSTRSIPSVNSTGAANSVTITRPAAIDADQSWNVYRTYNGDWSISYLATVPEATSTYVDTGVGAAQGGPPSGAYVTSSMTKIDLTAHVQGQLPITNVDFVVDEDDMVGNSATKVPTQQSVKAYVDASTGQVAAHLSDTADSHDASAISFAPVGTIAATDAQTAIAEVATDADAALTAGLATKVTKSTGWTLNGQAADKTLATYTPDVETTAYNTTLTDPTDAPVDADALREDLVANALPQLRQAMADLNSLRVAYENLRVNHEDLRAAVAALVTAIT